MGESFYIIKDWLELFAYIATILGAIGVIIGGITLIRNIPTKRKFVVKFKIIKAFWRFADICLSAETSLANYTDKDFSIISVILCINNIDYTVCTQPIPQKEFVPISDIHCAAHSSQIFKPCYIEIPQDLIFRSTILKVKTTVGDFVYRVSVREIINCIQNAQ